MTEHIESKHRHAGIVIHRWTAFSFEWPERQCVGYGVNFPSRIVLCIEPSGECVTCDHAAIEKMGVRITDAFCPPTLFDELQSKHPELCGRSNATTT